jgi:hypothetical protein
MVDVHLCDPGNDGVQDPYARAIGFIPVGDMISGSSGQKPSLLDAKPDFQHALE